MKHLKTFTDISGNDCVGVTVSDRAEISYTVGYETDGELAAYSGTPLIFTPRTSTNSVIVQCTANSKDQETTGEHSS